MEKRYMYRRKDGMEVYRKRRSPLLWIRGYRLLETVNMTAKKDVKG